MKKVKLFLIILLMVCAVSINGFALEDEEILNNEQELKMEIDKDDLSPEVIESDNDKDNAVVIEKEEDNSDLDALDQKKKFDNTKEINIEEVDTNENISEMDDKLYIELEKNVSEEVVLKDGVWRMIINGQVDYSYTGFGSNEYGMWYLENGRVTFKYNGAQTDSNGDTWIIKGSKVQSDLCKVMQVNGIWRMVINGKVEKDYEGIGTNENGTWYIKDGTIDFRYTGTYTEGDKTYLIEKSRVIATLDGNLSEELVLINGVWRAVRNGQIDYNYTGFANNEYGKWYVEAGKVTFKYNGFCTDDNGDTWIIKSSKVQSDLSKVMEIDGIWRMVINGKVEKDFEGIAKNENGTWYIKDGTIDFRFTGTYYEGNKAYIIEKSMVQAVVDKDTTELLEIKKVWRVIKNGEIDYDYTGVVSNKNGMWYVENGTITFRHNGACVDNEGNIWIAKGSKVQTDLNKVMEVNGIWRMVINGKVEKDYEGIGTNENGTWYIKDGTIDFIYKGTYYEGDKAYIIEKSMVQATVNKTTTGVVQVNKIWRMVINGKVDYEYTGIGANANGMFLIENGQITFKYNGPYTAQDSSTYTIKSSKVTEVRSLAGHPATMWVDEPISGNKYLSGTLNVSGWALADENVNTIKIYLDNKYVGIAQRKARPDVFDVYKNNEYGGITKNPTPGYYCSINTKGLSRGNHTVQIINYASDGTTIIQSREINFSITDLTKAWGIDVSQYQSEIRWNEVKARGVEFAIIRIGYYEESENSLTIDPYFERNYNECKKHGIAVGGYFYSYAFNSDEASREATACISAIRGKHFEMPIFLDVEDKLITNAFKTGGTNKNELTNASITFCNALNNAGYRSGVYANKNFFLNYLNVSALERYNIWLAHYTDKTDYTGKYDLWQYADDGWISGIDTPVDLDWCFTRYY